MISFFLSASCQKTWKWASFGGGKSEYVWFSGVNTETAHIHIQSTDVSTDLSAVSNAEHRGI